MIDCPAPRIRARSIALLFAAMIFSLLPLLFGGGAATGASVAAPVPERTSAPSYGYDLLGNSAKGTHRRATPEHAADAAISTPHVAHTAKLALESGFGAATKTGGGILPTPAVGSTKLQNIVNNLYKGTENPNRLGNGTTMDAIRNEVATGVPTGGRLHITKGRESLRGLNKWLGNNADAPYHDRLVAQSLADELEDVLPR